MKIKILGTLSLGAIALLAGCRGDSNANANRLNTNVNANVAVVATATPAPAMDSAAKTAVEGAMKKAGYNDVTVDATASDVTLRGSVPKGKLGAAVQVASETAKRKVNNQLTEK